MSQVCKSDGVADDESDLTEDDVTGVRGQSEIEREG